MTFSDPLAAAIYGWLWLTLVPFSVLGLALAYFGMKYEGVYTPASKRILGGLAVAIVLVGVGAAHVSAASVYDLCKDPAYADSWWWYAWGCYLY